MKKLILIFISLVALVFLLTSNDSKATQREQPLTQPIVQNPLLDYRYCGEPKRDSYGRITRRSDVVYAFQKVHPCPSTGKTTGACPGWARDHVIPLACGGCDSVSNIQWHPVHSKICWKDWCKDRFERKIYAVSPRKLKGTPHCTNEKVIITDK